MFVCLLNRSFLHSITSSSFFFLLNVRISPSISIAFLSLCSIVPLVPTGQESRPAVVYLLSFIFMALSGNNRARQWEIEREITGVDYGKLLNELSIALRGRVKGWIKRWTWGMSKHRGEIESQREWVYSWWPWDEPERLWIWQKRGRLTFKPSLITALMGKLITKGAFTLTAI